jgi:hypothetical protein
VGKVAEIDENLTDLWTMTRSCYTLLTQPFPLSYIFNVGKVAGIDENLMDLDNDTELLHVTYTTFSPFLYFQRRQGGRA